MNQFELAIWMCGHGKPIGVADMAKVTKVSESSVYQKIAKMLMNRIVERVGVKVENVHKAYSLYRVTEKWREENVV